MIQSKLFEEDGKTPKELIKVPDLAMISLKEITAIKKKITSLCTKLQHAESSPSQISILNEINNEIQAISPFTEPVKYIKWVKAETVQANEYNPNKVATPEMKLLHLSIKSDGYTQPIVCYDLHDGNYEVVDGFHRNLIGKTYEDIRKRTGGFLPIVIIDKPLDERIGSTIRHNRARGTHQIRGMSDIVIDLTEAGWTDDEICEKLGMELDEVVKLKQISGLKTAFQNHEFSKSWEEFESNYYGPKESEDT